MDQTVEFIKSNMAIPVDFALRLAGYEENDSILKDWASEEKIEELRKQLDEYKTTSVDVAVIGESGVGKSTFVNKIRGYLDEEGYPLEPKPDDYASTDIVKTTMKSKEYSFPGSKFVKLWDLPGAGTTDFQIDEYEKKVEFSKYDAFVLIVGNRIKENDMVIYEKIKRDEKPFFLARMKMDNDFECFKRDKGRNFTVDAWKNKCQMVRRTCIEDEGQNNDKAVPKIDYLAENVYLLSCMDYKIVKNLSEPVYFKDNQRILVDIPNRLPEIQKSALLFQLDDSLFAYGADYEKKIRDTKKQLDKRLWKVAAVSAGAGAIPVPGMSAAVDFAMFFAECNLQKKLFGLDENGLKRKEKNQMVEDLVDRIMEKVKSDSKTFFLPNALYKSCLDTSNQSEQAMLDVTKLLFEGAGKLASAGAVIGTTEVLEDTVALVLPVIGSVIAGAISGGTTYTLLKTMLHCHYQLALACNKVVKEQLKEDCQQRLG